MIRVLLPYQLTVLAGTGRVVELDVADPVTQRSVLDELETQYPALKGTVREHGTLARRPRVRFFADSRDVTHEAPDVPLPPAVASGREPFMIVGAVAGG